MGVPCKAAVREYQEKLRFSDARDFYERFFRAASCRVASVSTTREYYEFPEVAHFASQINGKGEPVEWIPCRIGVSV